MSENSLVPSDARRVRFEDFEVEKADIVKTSMKLRLFLNYPLSVKTKGHEENTCSGGMESAFNGVAEL